MKHLMLLALLVISTGPISGGNIDYLGNRSVAYLRNFARNAAVDGADMATYDPAGLVFLDEGLHLELGNQLLLKNYSIETVPFWDSTTVEKYDSREPTFCLPDFHAAYRTGPLAVFGSFTVPAGGGSLVYEKGLYVMSLLETGYQQAVRGGSDFFAVMSRGDVTMSSVYMAGTLGASYAVSDVLSLGLSGRYVTAERNVEGRADFVVYGPDSTGTVVPVDTTSRSLDVRKAADGMGGALSVHLKPTHDLDISLRFETPVPLEFVTDVFANDWEAAALPDSSFTDGYVRRRDLPAILAGGISFGISPELRLGTMFNYYFVEWADRGEEDGLDDDYENGSDIGIGLDWKVSSRLTASAGYLWSDQGGGSDTYRDMEYSLDYHSLGGGVEIRTCDAVALDLAGGRNFYLEGSGSGVYGNSTYYKSVWFFGLGVKIHPR